MTKIMISDLTKQHKICN